MRGRIRTANSVKDVGGGTTPLGEQRQIGTFVSGQAVRTRGHHKAEKHHRLLRMRQYRRMEPSSSVEECNAKQNEERGLETAGGPTGSRPTCNETVVFLSPTRVEGGGERL